MTSKIPEMYYMQMEEKDIKLCQHLLSEFDDLEFIAYNKSTIVNGELRNSVILFNNCIISLHSEINVCFINFNISLPPNKASDIAIHVMVECWDICSFVKSGENFMYGEDGRAIFGQEAQMLYDQLLALKMQKRIKQELIFDSMLYQDLESNGLEH